MPYKKGDVIRRDDSFRKILAVIDGIVFHSEAWCSEQGIKAIIGRSVIGSAFCTENALEESGWSLCPPDQTLLPAEKWAPEECQPFFYGQVKPWGDASYTSTYWDGGEFCAKLLSIGNVHKTSEEAIEWAKKRYNIA